MHDANIIKDASKGQASERKISDGIIKSAMLTSFQRSSIDGMIKSAIPEKDKKSDVPVMHKVKPNATKESIGLRKFPGAKG
jgi:hypothetical protein